jgi:hypothetical protein
MDKMAGSGLDPDCYVALQDAITQSGWPARSLAGDTDWDSETAMSSESGQQTA